MKKLLMTIISILFVIGLTACGNNIKFNLNDYIETSFKGVNGDIELTARINWADIEDVLFAEYQKRFDENEALLNAMGTSLVLKDCVEMEVSERTELSDGDKINIVFSVDEKRLKEYGIEMDYENFMIEVEEPELISFDPFENINVVFEGRAPYAGVRISLEEENDLYDLIEITHDGRYCNIGDMITVSCEEKWTNRLAEAGYKMSQTTKQYQVNEVDYYINKAEDITEEGWPLLKAEALKVLNEEKEEKAGYVNYTDFIYEGYYLLYGTRENYWNHYAENVLIMVYSSEVTNISGTGNFETVKIYYPVMFENVIHEVDGDYSINPGHIWVKNQEYMYYPRRYSVDYLAGCDNLEKIYDDLRFFYSEKNYECIVSNFE